MAFILREDFADDALNDSEVLAARFTAYRAYLIEIRRELPASAYEFAIADWHYDPQVPQCPHDGWVQTLMISELATGDRQQHRRIEISLKLLNAQHNGHIHLTYKDVKMYSLDTSSEFKLPPLRVGHGDWLNDEIRLSERGLVVHEIEFSRGSRWLIEAEDITYEWTPILILD
jgi:hypothetical protein